jgi:hypothetical protein
MQVSSMIFHCFDCGNLCNSVTSSDQYVCPQLPSVMADSAQWLGGDNCLKLDASFVSHLKNKQWPNCSVNKRFHMPDSYVTLGSWLTANHLGYIAPNGNTIVNDQLASMGKLS